MTDPAVVVVLTHSTTSSGGHRPDDSVGSGLSSRRGRKRARPSRTATRSLRRPAFGERPAVHGPGPPSGGPGGDQDPLRALPHGGAPGGAADRRGIAGGGGLPGPGPYPRLGRGPGR